jgi:uncharacterized protein
VYSPFFSGHMIISHYIKVYPYEEKPGYVLLFSTKKTSKILLKEATLNSIISRDISPEDEATLSMLGMIVPDAESEKKEVFRIFDEINEKNQTLSISVILNLDCNFNCIYCYEGGIKGSLYMTDETAGLLIDFIKSRFTPNKKNINLDFYGGEPLLSLELIRSISAEMKLFTESRGALYTFTLVTNGSLFKRRVAEELALLGLKGIKTTIDGPPEIHNTCRPFKSGAGSFDTIIKNIKDTWDIVKISIGGNYREGNYEKYPLLFHHFEKEGLTPDKIYDMSFYPVMKNPADISSSIDFTDGFMSLNEPWLIKASIHSREEIFKRGYNTPKLMPSLCQTELNNYYVVNYDGVIFKCPSFIGRKNFEIGNLREGVTDYSQSHKLGIWRNGECEKCEYLPLCFGGCRYMSYVRDGNIDSVDCQKTYLDAALETLIKQDIRYGPQRQDSR